MHEDYDDDYDDDDNEDEDEDEVMVGDLVMVSWHRETLPLS